MLQIIKKEELENILSMRFILGFLVCNLLFALGSFIFVNEFNDQLHVAQKKLAELDQEYEEWKVYSEVQPTVIRAPSPINVFGNYRDRSGISPIRIQRTKIPVFPEDIEEGFEMLDRNTLLNFPSIAGLFISLLAIIFTFDSVSGEKQRGSLRLILSCPISRTSVITGKVVGAIFSIFLIIASSMIIFLLVFDIFTQLPFSASNWLQVGLITLMLVLFSSVFTVLGVFISSLCHQPSTSLISSLFVWILLVVILPVVFSQGLSSQGLDEMVDESEKAVGKYIKENMDDLFESVYGSMRQEYSFAAMFTAHNTGAVRVWYAGRNCEAAIISGLPEMHSRLEERAQAIFSVDQELYQTIKDRKRTIDLWSSINPVNALYTGLRSLSETDIQANDRYLQQAREYRKQIEQFARNNGAFYGRQWFTNDSEQVKEHPFILKMESMASNRAYLRTPEGGAEQEAFRNEFEKVEKLKINILEMPRFEYISPPVTAMIDTCMLQVLSLACYLAVIFTAAYIRFLSYDVR